jgi:hypothetical protein
MDVKRERNARVSQFSHTIQWLQASCHANFIYVFTKRSNISTLRTHFTNKKQKFWLRAQPALGNNILIYQTLNQLPRVWKAKDGKYLAVTSIDQLTALGALVAAYVEAQFTKEFNLTGTVHAAAAVEDVEAIKWEI